MAEEGLLVELQEELVCPLCMDTLSDPRSLQCLHSYCGRCLEGLQKASALKGGVLCPECRGKTILPPGGVKELPSNFKLKNLVKLLTADQRKEIIRKRSLYNLHMVHRPQPLCKAHDGKLLEFYCEPCGEVICGQCLIDKHATHGGAKYASEVIGMHLHELKEILPDIEKVLGKGEKCLEHVKAESGRLNESLSDTVSSVSSYFTQLHTILKSKESVVLAKVTSHAKKKERRIQKHEAALEEAMEAMKKAKLTVEDAVDRRGEEIDVLLEENQLRGRIQAGMRLVEEEIGDFRKAQEDKVSTISSFTPDPSVEAKCQSIEYTVERKKKRSNTAIENARGRAGAFAGQNPTGRKRNMCKTLSGSPIIEEVSVLPSLRVLSAAPAAVHVSINFVQPRAEIGTKNLIGSYNTVSAYPFGVACTRSGSLLVTDSAHHLFRVLTPTGKCLETQGSEGKGDGQFIVPKGIAQDKDGNILVLDGNNPGRLQKFTETGKYITKYRIRGILNPTLSMSEPNDLVVLSSGNILVTDGAKACVHEFEGNGKYRGKFGDITDLKCPTGIAASDDRVVLTDSANHCFYILTVLGKLLSTVGMQGGGDGQLHTPFGVAVDQHCNIIISECGNHRISIFTPGGQFLRNFGCKGSQLGMFRSPRLLCFNYQGMLVVTDEQNQRLQLFDLSDLEL